MDKPAFRALGAGRKLMGLFLVLVICSLGAQNAPVIQNFGRAVVNDLRGSHLNWHTPRLRGGALQRKAFFHKVGGIAFEGVASPPMRFRTVELHFDPSKENGSRASVRFDRGLPSEAGAIIPLHDWQLEPIVRYAAFNQKLAAVSLFGQANTPRCAQLVDIEQEDPVCECDTYRMQRRHNLQYVISFHEAFEDSLLGWRLLQMDSVLTDNFDYAALPSDGGTPIMGAGESATPGKPVEELPRLQPLFQKYENATRAADAGAYVISDDLDGVSFQISERRIVPTGQIFFHFWVNTDFENGYRRENQELIDLGKGFRANWTSVRELNPAVYDAVNNVMRYSAFFRYVKKLAPGRFEAFKNHIVKEARFTSWELARTPGVIENPVQACPENQVLFARQCIDAARINQQDAKCGYRDETVRINPGRSIEMMDLKPVCLRGYYGPGCESFCNPKGGILLGDACVCHSGYWGNGCKFAPVELLKQSPPLLP